MSIWKNKISLKSSNPGKHEINHLHSGEFNRAIV